MGETHRRPTCEIMHTQCKKGGWIKCTAALLFTAFIWYCAGKQQRSYFRNEAIKWIQNEHNPLVNRHMAMSFACLWITNLWGEFLQMEFSMPCALCFKHSKQTNKSILGPQLLHPLWIPPRSASLAVRWPTADWRWLQRPSLTISRIKIRVLSHYINREGGGWWVGVCVCVEERGKYHLKLTVAFLFFLALN